MEFIFPLKMSLNVYLSAKLNKNNVELNNDIVNDEQNDEIIESYQSSPIKPRKTPFAQEEDYSPGSAFWKNAKSRENQEANVAKSRKSPTTSFPNNLFSISTNHNMNSVAKLLKKMKDSDQIGDGGNIFVNQLKDKSESAETIIGHNPGQEVIEQFSISLKSQLEDITKSISHEYAQLKAMLNQRTAHSDSLNDLRDTIKKGHEEIKQSLSSRQPHDYQIDRPTKALISSIQDKVIFIGKTQDHEFSSQSQKLSILEKKLSKPNPLVEKIDSISLLVASVDEKLKMMENARRVDFEKLERIVETSLKNEKNLSSLSTDEQSDSGESAVLDEIRELKNMWTTDQKITQDRMSQFMSMFSILQDVHGNLLGQLQRQVKAQTELEKRLEKIQAQIQLESFEKSAQMQELKTKIDNIHSILVSYLPLNLESKLRSIHNLLEQKNN